jgi:hypothetical protein
MRGVCFSVRALMIYIFGEINYSGYVLLADDIVTCQPIVGLRKKSLLGSRPLNASRPNTRCAAVGEAGFAPCRAERCCTAGAMTSHVFTWLPGDKPPSRRTARGMGDVT